MVMPRPAGLAPDSPQFTTTHNNALGAKRGGIGIDIAVSVDLNMHQGNRLLSPATQAQRSHQSQFAPSLPGEGVQAAYA